MSNRTRSLGARPSTTPPSVPDASFEIGRAARVRTDRAIAAEPLCASKPRGPSNKQLNAKHSIDADRRALLKLLAGSSGLILIGCGGPQHARRFESGYDPSQHYWAYAIDTTRCIGCCACMRACREENDVPEGRYRTWVERYQINGAAVSVDVATGPEAVFEPLAGPVAKAFFVPKLCNHCARSVCSQVCPVGAAYRTEDGVVLVDEKHCVGCGYCVQACPYGTRFINPRRHVADKCTFCYHRITRGLRPACVEACPTGARMFGDLRDPKSHLHTILRQRRYRLLRPELGTHPRCYYIGLDLEVI